MQSWKSIAEPIVRMMQDSKQEYRAESQYAGRPCASCRSYTNAQSTYSITAFPNRFNAIKTAVVRYYGQCERVPVFCRESAKIAVKTAERGKNKNRSAVNIVFNVFQDVSETSAMKTENIAKNRTAEEFKEAV